MPRQLRSSSLVAALTVAVALPACVRYRPAPLPDPAAAVATLTLPSSDVLRMRAAALQHPAVPAADIDLADGLSPDEAAVVAVLVNPDLAAVRDARGEAEAQLVAAGLLPTPTLTAEVDRPYGSGSAGTVDQLAGTLELDLAAIIQRRARRDGAAASLAEVDLGVAWQEWQVGQDARLQTVRIGWLERRVAIAGDELAAEQRTLTALQAAMAEGDVALPDVGVNMAAVEGLRRGVAELRRSLLDARATLASLLGVEPGQLPTVHPAHPLSSPSAALDADTLSTWAVAHRLDLLALRHGYDAQEAAVRVAVLSQLPGISVGLAGQRNETGLRFLGGFVSLGLPVFGNPRAAISLAEATRTRLGDEYVARLAAVRSEIFAAVDRARELAGQIDGAAAGAARLRDVVDGEADAVLRGDVDRLTAQNARSALTDVRLEEAALRQALAETLSSLQAVVGTQLATVPAAGETGASP